MDVKSFKERYESLPANEQSAKRKLIMESCDWSPSTFARKMRMPETCSKLERKELAVIFGCEVAEMFSAEAYATNLEGGRL